MARRKAVKPGVAGVVCPHCNTPLRLRVSARVDAGAVARARKRELAKARLEARVKAVTDGPLEGLRAMRAGAAAAGVNLEG